MIVFETTPLIKPPPLAGVSDFTLPLLVLAAFIALGLMPKVYEKVSVQPSVPFIVRLGLFVQHGVFWQVLFDAIGKVIAS